MSACCLNTSSHTVGWIGGSYYTEALTILGPDNGHSSRKKENSCKSPSCNKLYYNSDRYNMKKCKPEAEMLRCYGSVKNQFDMTGNSPYLLNKRPVPASLSNWQVKFQFDWT